MYHNTKFYAPKPIRASEMGFAFHHTNSCDAGFPRTIAPVDTTSSTAAPPYYSSAEAVSSTFLSATGQVGYAASDGPGRIESTAFNPYGLDSTLTSASFENVSWSSAGSVQGPLTHVNLVWAPNTNPTDSSATGAVIPLSFQTGSMPLTTYPVFPEEHYQGRSRYPGLQNTTPGNSSRRYGLDVHSTFHLPPQSTGSLPGGSSRGSNFPPRVIAPIPRRATQAMIPYDTLLRPAMPVSFINPLDTMLSTRQHASGTSNLTNVTGDHGFMAINEPYSAPAFDSGHPSQAAAVTESRPTARVEHARNMGNQVFSPSTVLDQSTGRINSFEEGVETKNYEFSLVTGGGSSTSSGEATVMINTKQARHGQRFHGSTVRSEAAKKTWRKRKAADAPLAPSPPKRARSDPSPRPSAVNLGNLRYQEKNQRTIASATEGTSFNQGGVKGYVAYPLPGESVVHADRSKGVSKMKMKKRKLEDVPVRRVVPCDM